jgi:biopolymer transport protein ExbD
VLEELVEAVIDEDFEDEWSLLSAEARAQVERTLQHWRDLRDDDPEAHAQWVELERTTGLTRDQISGMDAEEWFVACREGKAMRDPEWWAAEKEGLRTLDLRGGELTLDGDNARISFETDSDGIGILSYAFVREDDDWLFARMEVATLSLVSKDWQEPGLDLPWAEGASEYDPEENDLIVNMLSDGSIDLGGEKQDLDTLRERLRSGGEERGKVLLRFDAAVPWRRAAEVLALAAEEGIGDVQFVTTPARGVGSRTPRSSPRKKGESWFQTLESRFPFALPAGEVSPATILIEAGARGVGEGDLSPFGSRIAGARVLLDPDPEASWDTVVLLLGGLAAAGAGETLLASPGGGGKEAGLRVSDVPADHPVLSRVIQLTAAAREENPRNVRYDRPVIEHLYLDPKKKVREIGDRPGPPPGEGPAVLTVHLRHCGGEAARIVVVLGDDGSRLGDPVGLEAGATAEVRGTFPVAEIPYGVQILLRRADGEGEVLDRATLHDDRAHRVLLLVERRTWEAGQKRFGSLVRRFRGALSGLHLLLDETPGEAVRDRFRIDRVEVYDRADAARPRQFDDHPDHDLAVACDEGGPLAGFWLPAYSVGHNFRAQVKGRTHDLWSSWGEQALWHEMVHYRGVPDFYIYRVPAGCLTPWTEEAVDLPEPWRGDLMNSAYQEPRLGALAAAVMNAKRGVSRVGACEEPDHPYGHMWRWLPKRLVLSFTQDGRPLAGATVRWWASEPAGLSDRRLQKVGEGRPPDATAVTDEKGRVVVTGDYMNAGKDRMRRSLWLLVEAEHEGERRFEVVRGLWLNAAWAEGRKEEATRSLEWEKLYFAE